MAKVSSWDIVAIVVYFIIVLCIGFYAMYKANRGTVSGYFLAGRFMGWLPVGASLFASNIGSEHFVGLAGSGAAKGIGVGAFELNSAATVLIQALIVLQLLGWVLLPVYIASGVHTLPEFLRLRFGGQRIRRYLACLSLLLYILTKISVNMYCGALFVKEAFGWNIYLGIVLILSMTAICTVTGGLTAVIYTDTLQCIVMILGASGLSMYCFHLVGGYTGLVEQYMAAIPKDADFNSSCGYPTLEAFTMLRDPADEDLPWPGFLLGQSPASIWYWGADQMIVQRALAAKSLSHAQGATIFAGYLKILPLFLLVLPGMVSRILYTDDVACVKNCAEICGNAISCSNLAYPILVVRLMPDGFRGIMLAVLLAALMSDLTSIFNSSATLFTIDIWSWIRPKCPEREKMIVGRVFVLFMVLLSLAWVPVIQLIQGGQLYSYIQSVSADLSPPIAAVYLLAILWSRCNEKGAFWGLISGLLVGLVRMALDFAYQEPPCGHPDLRPLISRLHYMYFALILFWLTVIITVVVSFLTPKQEDWRLIRTTYWTRFDQRSRPDDNDYDQITSATSIVSANTNKKSTPPKDGRKKSKSSTPTATPSAITDKPALNSPTESPTKTNVEMKTFVQQKADANNNNWDPNSLYAPNGFEVVKSWLIKAGNWFIGIDSTNKTSNDDDDNRRMEKITHLNQTEGENTILTLNLILVLSVAIFMYIFFSVGSPIIAGNAYANRSAGGYNSS